MPPSPITYGIAGDLLENLIQAVTSALGRAASDPAHVEEMLGYLADELTEVREGMPGGLAHAA